VVYGGRGKDRHTERHGDIETDGRPGARARYWLLALCMVIALATTAAFASVLILSYRSALNDAAVASNRLVSGFEHYARQSFSEVSGLLGELRSDLASIDLDDAAAGGEIASRLGSGARRLVHTSRFVVAMWDGQSDDVRQIAGRGGLVLPAADITAHVAAHRDRQTAVHIGTPLRETDGAPWLIPVSIPMLSPDGRLSGLVLGLVEPRHFIGTFGAFRVGQEGSVTLYRRDGLLLAREPTNPDLTGKSLAHAPVFRDHLAASPRGTFRVTTTIDGIDRVVSYASVAQFPLVVVVGIGTHEVLASWRVLAIQSLGLYGGILAMLAGFGWIIWRQLRGREIAAAKMRQVVGRLSGLIDSVPGIVYERHTSPDGKVSFPFIGGRSRDIAGVSAHELMRDPDRFWRLVHPDDRGGLLGMMQDDVASGATVAAEYRIVPPSGTVRWLLAGATSRRHPAGSRTAYGVAIDVTARKQAEADARAANDRLRELINAVPGVVYQRRQANGRIDYPFVSDKSLAILCVTAKDMTADPQNFWNHIHPDDRTRLLRQTRESARDHKPVTLEFRVLHPGGEERWVTTTSTPHAGPNGETLWEGVGIDITEQKRATAALAEREREQRLRLIANNLPVSITYLDNEGHYQFVNRTAETWHGRTAGETMGRSVAEVLPASVLGGRGGTIDELLAGRTIHAERWQHFPDGRERLLEDMLVPDLTDEGTVRGIINLSIDITERRATEERLRQSQRMESLGQLAGGIAHDFNNILGVIVGSLDVLLYHLGDRPRERELVDRVLSAARRGASLTNRLLMVANRRTLQPMPTDLNVLVRELASLLGGTLGERISLSTVLAEDLSPCLVDPGGLESAIVNLAINARDAMPDGGRLEIVTRDRPAQTGAADGDFVSLMVRDTGTGMPPEVAQRAFEPFFTTKEIGRGTGLGLSMVYGFVMQSGGRISLKSDPGLGTEIEILLPRTAHFPTTATAVLPPTFRARGQAVLVVEDDRDMRAFVTEALVQAGLTVVAAADAESALALAAERDDIELVVSDVILPGGMNGLALVRELRRRRPGIRAVVTSGYVHGEVQMMRAAPDTDILRKPFRVEELIDRVARQFDLADTDV